MHARPFHLGTVATIALLFAGVLLTGCEEDVVAVLNTDRPYSLYGYIDPRADTQWVAVFSIEGRLTPIQSEPLDAVFTSTSLSEGTETIWRDSTYRYADGTTAHLFWAPFRASYGEEYLLEVRRSDDAASTVTVAVPPLAEFSRQEPIVSEIGIDQARVLLPILLEGDVPRPRNVEAHYFVKYDTTGSSVATVTLPYDAAVQETTSGWRIVLDMNTDFVQIRQELIRRGLFRPAIGISLLALEISGFISNEDWAPPGEEIDAELLANPGLFDNVEHGFGFVGSGYTNRAFVTPLHEITRKAGFAPQF